MKPKDLIAVFDNDRDLVKAIGTLKENNIPVKDVWTPFPVHDVLKMLGRESRLPYFSVVAGVGAVIMTFAFLYYTAVIDYPIRYGGKPYFAFPSFVVIIFLLTILLTFISTVIVFQVRTGLFPGKEAEVPVTGTTDDKFVISVGSKEGLTDEIITEAQVILSANGAVEITEQER